MVYKASQGYDDILHAGADDDFINQFLVVNRGDLEKAKAQLLEFYNSESINNLQKCTTSAEKTIAQVLSRRNIALIERGYLKIKMVELSKKATLGEDGFTRNFSPKDSVEYAEMNVNVAQKNLDIEKDTIGLLTVSSNVSSGVIFGKERDTLAYQEELERRTIEDSPLKKFMLDLDMATEILNNAYQYYKDLSENSGPKM